jgi:ATP-dependent Clp endopeptidase proteolytic subunit ClpP
MNHGARPLRSTRRVSNLAGSRPAWYSITNKSADAGPCLVSIYDEIGFFGVSAGDFLAELRTIQGDIELHISSPGGDVFDAIAIYNTLKQRTGNVHVIVDSLAASAASFVAQAASPGCLEMAPHSRMMIHDGFAMGIGNAADMRALADSLDSISDEIAGIYADRTGKPAAYWRGLMQTETWLTDQQAVAEGLADKIHGQESVANDWDLSVFAHYIDGGTGVGNAARACPACGKFNASDAENCSTCKKPMAAAGDDGMHGDHKRVDPDGDGDCDACASGDTDHDYWTEDGQSKKPLPGHDAEGKPVPAAAGLADVLRIRNASVDESTWDASKAWAAGADSDDPAKFYGGICAGRKAGDPSTQAAWALPYKYSPSSAPNAAGVRNALARLDQTQGLTNKPEAEALLKRLMKQINPDYEPDDSIDSALLAELFTTLTA